MNEIVIESIDDLLNPDYYSVIKVNLEKNFCSADPFEFSLEPYRKYRNCVRVTTCSNSRIERKPNH